MKASRSDISWKTPPSHFQRWAGDDGMKERAAMNSNIRRASCLLFVLLLVSLLFGFTSLSEAAELYEQVKIDNGQLHILTTDHKEILPPKRTFNDGEETLVQMDFAKAAISENKTIVGWLADYPNCCTSYPIPLELIILRNGKIVRVFTGTGLPVWRWKFMAKGTQVAFEQETVHGGLGIHYELRDIKTGDLIESYDGEPQPDAPQWVLDLKR
jgi:hypothetical protein